MHLRCSCAAYTNPMPPDLSLEKLARPSPPRTSWLTELDWFVRDRWFVRDPSPPRTSCLTKPHHPRCICRRRPASFPHHTLWSFLLHQPQLQRLQRLQQAPQKAQLAFETSTALPTCWGQFVTGAARLLFGRDGRVIRYRLTGNNPLGTLAAAMTQLPHQPPISHEPTRSGTGCQPPLAQGRY